MATVTLAFSAERAMTRFTSWQGKHLEPPHHGNAIGLARVAQRLVIRDAGPPILFRDQQTDAILEREPPAHGGCRRDSIQRWLVNLDP
jgi:hypothetical protein